jgi:hypothetical protein
MRHLRSLAVILACLFAGLFAGLAASPVFAADPVFPKGARIGLVPLEGLTPATTFPGFEATDKRVKVIVTELPKETFASIEAGFKSDQLSPGQQPVEPFELPSGVKALLRRETAVDEGTHVRRFSLLIAGTDFAGYVGVQVPDDAGPAYSDAAVRGMLTSATLRKDVPIPEQLEQLPFQMTDLGGFKTMRTLPGGPTVLLTDSATDEDLDTQPYMLIGIMGTAPSTPDDRGRFAQQVAAALPGLRDAHVTSSEPMRIDGTPGYETRIDALAGKNSTPVTLVQWLRFAGNSVTLRIVAASNRDAWPASFTRFRAVRDGIQPR